MSQAALRLCSILFYRQDGFLRHETLANFSGWPEAQTFISHWCEQGGGPLVLSVAYGLRRATIEFPLEFIPDGAADKPWTLSKTSAHNLRGYFLNMLGSVAEPGGSERFTPEARVKARQVLWVESGREFTSSSSAPREPIVTAGLIPLNRIVIEARKDNADVAPEVYTTWGSANAAMRGFRERGVKALSVIVRYGSDGQLMFRFGYFPDENGMMATQIAGKRPPGTVSDAFLTILEAWAAGWMIDYLRNAGTRETQPGEWSDKIKRARLLLEFGDLPAASR